MNDGSAAFDLMTHHRHPVIALQGDITGTATDDLYAVFESAADSATRLVGLDMTRVRDITSSGIAIIVGLLRRARDAGLRLRAWGLTDHYREIFEVTQLALHIELFDDEGAAFAGAEA